MINIDRQAMINPITNNPMNQLSWPISWLSITSSPIIKPYDQPSSLEQTHDQQFP